MIVQFATTPMLMIKINGKLNIFDGKGNLYSPVFLHILKDPSYRYYKLFHETALLSYFYVFLNQDKPC